MSDVEVETPDAPKKKGLPIGTILGALVPVVMGGVAAGLAFFLTPAPTTCAAAASGHEKSEEPALLGEDHGDGEKHAKKGDKKSSGHGESGSGEAAFVPMDPLVVTLGPESEAKYLKITMTIETEKGSEAAVAALMPRLRDVVNGYLRAVEEADLVEPASMARVRAQLLRRLQLVAPDARITNVLITDFVLT